PYRSSCAPMHRAHRRGASVVAWGEDWKPDGAAPRPSWDCPRDATEPGGSTGRHGVVVKENVRDHGIVTDDVLERRETRSSSAPSSNLVVVTTVERCATGSGARNRALAPGRAVEGLDLRPQRVPGAGPHGRGWERFEEVTPIAPRHDAAVQQHHDAPVGPRPDEPAEALLQPQRRLRKHV